jgi:hypothetical protein
MTTPNDSGQGPGIAQAWERLVPGSAEMLLRDYHDQLLHRRRIEQAYVRLAFFGPVLGLIVVLCFLGTAAWLIYEGHGVEGTFLGTVDIASLAAVFALGRQGRFTSGSIVKSRATDEPILQPEANVSSN